MPAAATAEFVRVSGLYRPWEVPALLNAQHEFVIEPSGSTTEGEELFAVYARPADSDSPAHESAP